MVDGHHRHVASLIAKKKIDVTVLTKPQEMRVLSEAAHSMAKGISEALGTQLPGPERPLRFISQAEFDI